MARLSVVPPLEEGVTPPSAAVEELTRPTKKRRRVWVKKDQATGLNRVYCPGCDNWEYPDQVDDDMALHIGEIHAMLLHPPK